METFYLVDFENVHNEGLENIDSLTQTEHVHIFSTKNALNIRMDFVFSNEIDIKGHIVPVRKQSLDMHLVSYLGYLLGIHGKECAYVIVSKDTDYDNIINFWKEKGYQNISRKQKIRGTLTNQKTAQSVVATTNQTANSKISKGMAYYFSGEDKSRLHQFMQRGLNHRRYSLSEDIERICEIVVDHCNDERILDGIKDDLKEEFNNYEMVYKDVENILDKFVFFKRKAQVESFFGQHFRKKIYTDNKEKIIEIIINAKTKQQIKNDLMKLYADGNVVKHIYQTIQPLTKDLPGK